MNQVNFSPQGSRHEDELENLHLLGAGATSVGGPGFKYTVDSRGTVGSRCPSTTN